MRWKNSDAWKKRDSGTVTNRRTQIWKDGRNSVRGCEHYHDFIFCLLDLPVYLQIALLSGAFGL